MAGIELADLPLDRALNILTSLAVDDAIPVVAVETKKGIELYDRNRSRGEVLARLHGTGAAVPATQDTRPLARAARPASPGWDRATWGLLPEHQAAQRAAMSFAAELT